MRQAAKTSGRSYGINRELYAPNVAVSPISGNQTKNVTNARGVIIVKVYVPIQSCMAPSYHLAIGL
jgi:hypothetical protein